VDEDTDRTVIPTEASGSDREAVCLARLRSGLGGMYLVAAVVLAAMLLPLIIGPFVVVYEFARAGAYGSAGLVASTFGASVFLVLRAVRRGELGVGVVGMTLVFVALLIFMAMRLPR
jgi:hypothetical protein